jgi:outer membrane protein
MKTKIFMALAVLSIAVACKSEGEKVKKDTKPTVITRFENDFVIAFYHNDSLKDRFEYYKKEDAAVIKKQKAFESEVKRRSKELESYVQRNDEKARNGLLSQNEILQIQQKAQMMEQTLMQYQQTEGAKIEEESVKKLEVIAKKIEVLGKQYCEKNGIDILMIHGAGGQINYIQPKMNVTTDFIRFLNENQANIEKDLK